MPVKTIAFQDGGRKVFVTIHPVNTTLSRRALEKAKRKQGLRLTEQSDGLEKIDIFSAVLREIIQSVEIQDDGGERHEASSIEVNELFFGNREKPIKSVYEAAQEYQKELDQDFILIEGN